MDAGLAETRGCSVRVGDPSPDAPHHYVFVVIVRDTDGRGSGGDTRMFCKGW
jgi:hypothetical protein